MKKILVVDNHPVMLDYMKKFLSGRGFTVITAEDGISALEVLKTHLPDVIFIDLVMPNISGDKLCRIIRSRSKFKDVPIVVISAIAAEQQPDITAFGADACIAKCSFKKMPEHILGILNELEIKPKNRLTKKIIGIEDIYARAITKELLSTKRHYELILQNIAQGILELNLDGKIIYANSTALDLTRLSEELLLSLDFVDFFEGAHRRKVKELLNRFRRSFQPLEADTPLQFNEKEVELNLLPVNDNGGKTIVVILTDVTEKKRMEVELQRAEKMKVIGALAGGVAHDLNNVLAGLVSYPELLLMEVGENSALAKPIRTIQRSGEKAVAIVQDLLTLARRGVAITEVVNLNTIITEYLESPEFEKLNRYHPKVRVSTNLEAGLLNIMGSAVHLSKTVMNLVSNASEAMPDGGTVTVTTENRYVDKPLKGYETVEEGDYVTLGVADTGVGISPDTLDRIFEPFYSKKVLGRSGTGLGMTVVYGTVKDHEGRIDIRSTEGKGTVFTLYFPITREELENRKPPVRIEDYMGQGQRILVVDDVEEQRIIASGMLNKLGYRVATVSGGEEALAHLEEHPVDLVILDMIMDPGISGLETYKNLVKIRPDLKAFITSGFSETDTVKKAQDLGAGRYVKKPYTLEKIGLAVKEELEKE